MIVVSGTRQTGGSRICSSGSGNSDDLSSKHRDQSLGAIDAHIGQTLFPSIQVGLLQVLEVESFQQSSRRGNRYRLHVFQVAVAFRRSESDSSISSRNGSQRLTRRLLTGAGGASRSEAASLAGFPHRPVLSDPGDALTRF